MDQTNKLNRLVCLALLSWAFIGINGTPAICEQDVSFNRDIRPILSDRCFACHGPDVSKRKGKLRLDVPDGKDGAYRTLDDITAIKPGSLKDSELWYRITTDEEGDVMPPPKSHKKTLSKDELELFKQWIESGAPYDDFWAFVVPTKPAVPSVKNRDWSKQPIDLHVLKKLEAANLSPSKEADKRTLIRRVTFDLTGLPPTLNEIKAFLEDKRPDAYAQLVEKLLSRSQYGEHMARYWLDLVRFADTNGMHKDFYRDHIAYRDWVIRAMNENLGYDDFVRYQLAGDLYPKPTNDQLAASGFHRLHLIIDRGTALPEESFAKNVFDRVSAVGTTFMGMTLHCARCHDHKYDPIAQKDYYSLFAFLNNIDAAPETPGRSRDGLQQPFVSFTTPQQTKALSDLSNQLNSLAKQISIQKKAVANQKVPAKKKALAGILKKLEAQSNSIKKKRDEFERSIPRAMVMKERSTVRPTFIFKRGEYDKPGDQVERNTPAFLPPMKKKAAVASRMDLAEWFVDPSNPLTSRVAANRIWQQFFGVGLVKTSEDLGAQGEVPSHPELLDHLAVSFVDSGWDVKALVKHIVLSQTYRQASSTSPEQYKTDPENRMLARGSRFRMDAEMIRDQILASSGLLSKKMFGPSVKPPQPDGLWKAVSMTGQRFRADTGESIYRRSVYTFWKRAMPPPQMTILNAPNRDACIARRERTNTPSAALLLLNEGEYLKAARQLALTTLDQKNLSTKQRIAHAYETVTTKLPDPSEQAIFQRLIKQLEKEYLKKPQLASALCDGLNLTGAKERARLAAWTILGNVLYNLDITKTRE